MLTHTTSDSPHWVLTDKGADCTVCGQTGVASCIDTRAPGKPLFPRHTVHLKRVRNAGHNVLVTDLPVHRHRIPDGALAELRRLK